MRPLSPDSARIANDLLDANDMLDANFPAQEIAEIVNLGRIPQGHGALAELGAMATLWRRDHLPTDPTPYQSEDIQQHRLNRASGSSMPPASLPSSFARTPLPPAKVRGGLLPIPPPYRLLAPARPGQFQNPRRPGVRRWSTRPRAKPCQKPRWHSVRRWSTLGAMDDPSSEHL